MKSQLNHRKFLAVFLLTTLLSLSGTARATDYYVSPSGNNSNLGTSPAQAWQTIGKVNSVAFAAGDSIFFEAGQAFSGSLYFDSNDAGTKVNPVTVGSYGGGRATISSGSNHGLYAYNCAGFEVKDLIFVGSGRTDTNGGSGIFFYMDLLGDVKLEHVIIDNVDVSGYRATGIAVGAWNGLSGFKYVRITNAISHDNGDKGIYAYGYMVPPVGWANQDVYIGDCKAYNNAGNSGWAPHTGNGIMVSQTDGAIIEFCEAYNNGWLDDTGGGGPIGIWAWDANNVIIQFCESHHNKTGPGTVDGGGFDFDGGVVNSILQYNYSHHNYGAGYLFGQYTGARKWKNNIVRYNISENDGLKNGYGAISTFGDNSSGGTQDLQAYNNTLYVGPDSTGGGVVIWGTELHNAYFRNNIIQTAGGHPLLRADTPPDVNFQGNCYWSSGDSFEIKWSGSTYTSLADWRSATGQEKIGVSDVGFELDPQLVNPGGGGTIADPCLLWTLNDYRLQSSSPLINAGLDLQSLFGIDPGAQDYFGTSIPTAGQFEVGAHEYDFNAPPVARSDNYLTAQDMVLNVDANSGVLANDFAHSGTLTAILVSGPSNGLLTLNSNGSFNYDPNAGFMGTDTFTYKAYDGEDNSNVVAVYIDVLDPHPIANNDNYSTANDTTLNVDANSGVLANDFSPSGGPLTATLVSPPSNGTLTLNSNGSFEYDPNTGFAGTDIFTYRASAAGYDSNVTSVYIDVEEPVAWDNVINYSFELDNDGNQITCHTSQVGIGWTSINTWVGVDIYCGAPGACGNCRSPIPPDANCYCYMQTNNTYLYQTLDINIDEGTQYTLTFDAQTGNSGVDIVPSLFYLDSSSHVEITSSTIPLSTGAWNYDLTLSFTAAAAQPYLGKKLGIKLHAPVPGDMNTGKWIFLDNVRLDLHIDADFNSDEVVNFFDYAELAAAWGTSLGQPGFNDIYDLYDDDIINLADLGIFATDWVWGLGP